MNITHQTVIGENGEPQAAIIPWNVFIEIQEIVDSAKPTAEELEAMQEAEADRRNDNTDAFTDLEDLKAELSL